MRSTLTLGFVSMLALKTGRFATIALVAKRHESDFLGQLRLAPSLARGLRVFDAAVGGLGGCPYAPGAAGNVASEAVDARLRDLGYETGLDAAALARAAGLAKSMRGNADV